MQALDKNPIDFPGYSEKKEIIKKETNLEEAVITGKASIGHIEVMLGVCDTRYLMGSMGYIVGEKITKLFENATKAQLPVIMINCSGGARMQEGIISLMQMAKTVDSVKQHIEEFDVCDNYQNEVEKIYSDISKKVNPILQKITDYFNSEHILQ